MVVGSAWKSDGEAARHTVADYWLPGARNQPSHSH